MKERLFKKNVLNVKPFFVHVAQVMDVVILHVSFVHVSIYVAMNMFGMYMVHYTLWCQKNLEMSIEYLKRATFIIKKEVGGRELTKLWVYSLVLPSQLRFPPNVFFPNFVRGGMVQSLDRCAMMGCPSFLFCIWQKKVKRVNAWTWNMFNRFPHSALREKVRVSHLHSVKKTVWTLVHLGDLTRCGVWNVWTYWYVYMLLYV